MPDFSSVNKQADDPHKTQRISIHRYHENSLLFSYGFKQTQYGLWWEKDGDIYGKEAALQKARSMRHLTASYYPLGSAPLFLPLVLSLPLSSSSSFETVSILLSNCTKPANCGGVVSFSPLCSSLG